MKYKLGDTVVIREPVKFKIHTRLFEDIIGFDKWGPIFKPEPVHYQILDTPEKVEEFNRLNAGS